MRASVKCIFSHAARGRARRSYFAYFLPKCKPSISRAPRRPMAALLACTMLREIYGSFYAHDVLSLFLRIRQVHAA